MENQYEARILLHTFVVDILLPGIKGLRWSSSTLSEEENAVHPRPSELTCTDPSLIYSLMES